MRRFVVVALAIVILVFLVLASLEFILPNIGFHSQSQNAKRTDFHLGVSFCGNTTAQAELLIDRVKDFTNLFVMQSGPVSTNETALNEIVNYAVASGLDVIVYFGYFNPNYEWQIPWLDYAKQQWGSHFLGVYLHDEPGGIVIDANWTGYYEQLSIRNSSIYYQHQPEISLAMNGTLPLDNSQLNEAAYHFVSSLQNDSGLNELKSRSINAFTSDYALYWFDYLGGYNTIFAELGSNQSATQAIDMVRGAADLQNKTWGTIITWTYDQPPYIENSTALYNQLLASYMAGADYEVIFDYPQVQNNPYGILTEQHFAAIEKFWNYIQTLQVKTEVETALVLPQNYGWGMRNPQDLIWGIWKPDNTTSTQIWNTVQKLLSEYGLNLDIVYQDSQYPVQGKYRQIYYINQTS